MDEQERLNLIEKIRAEIAYTRNEVAALHGDDLLHAPQNTPEARLYWNGIGRVEALADVLQWMNVRLHGDE